MSLSIELEDGRGGTKHKARVTKRGQLVVAPLDFSTPYFNEMSVNDQVYNFVEPVAGKQFVVTGVLVNADRDVGPNGTIVHMYLADAVDSNTDVVSVFTIDMSRSSVIPMTGLNVILPAGKWLNADTNDNTVFLTILGYYVDVV